LLTLSVYSSSQLGHVGIEYRSL